MAVSDNVDESWILAILDIEKIVHSSVSMWDTKIACHSSCDVTHHYVTGFQSSTYNFDSSLYHLLSLDRYTSFYDTNMWQLHSLLTSQLREFCQQIQCEDLSSLGAHFIHTMHPVLLQLNKKSMECLPLFACWSRRWGDHEVSDISNRQTDSDLRSPPTLVHLRQGE